MNKYDSKRLKELKRKKRIGTLHPDMEPYYEWLAGKRSKLDHATEAHLKAREIITGLKKDMTQKQIADKFDTYPPLIYRIINQEYSRVPESKCKEIVENFSN